MKIKIISLALLNFKGIRAMTVEFGDDITNISGRNKLGKTTIKDAFRWLLFGKDSTDRKDFAIKTLDKNNEPFHRLDHEVTGVLEVDGDRVTIRRLLQENWVARRGSKDKEFKGHNTSYYWNEVPLKLGEYEAKISDILNETIFKLITDTDYFNTRPWQERRQILMSMAGEITNDEVFDKIITLATKQNFAALINALNAKKSIDEYRKELANKKNKIKDEMEGLPGRISEANNSLPDPVDYDAIEQLLEAATKDLEDTDALLMNQTEAERTRQRGINEKLLTVQGLQQQKQTITNQVTMDTKQLGITRQSEINDAMLEKKTLEGDINRLTSEYTTKNTALTGMRTTKEKLGQDWDKVTAETLVLNPNEFCCPTCRREFEAGTVETKKQELTNNFNQDKSRRLEKIKNDGIALATDIKTAETELENLKAKGTAKRTELDKLIARIQTLQEEHTRKSNDELQIIQTALEQHAGIIEITQQITKLNAEIDAPAPEQGNKTQLLQKKQALTADISGYTTKMATKTLREKTEARITELTDRESALGTELADFEGIEFSIDQFVKAKMDTLESRINHRFKEVQFKMFEKQINEGERECCETLIGGVPYSDANTASRINAGIDIINTLSDHYNVNAPVFVDNAESVNTLIPLNSQLIRLVVSLDDKLKIETAAA